MWPLHWQGEYTCLCVCVCMRTVCVCVFMCVSVCSVCAPVHPLLCKTSCLKPMSHGAPDTLASLLEALNPEPVRVTQDVVNCLESGVPLLIPSAPVCLSDQHIMFNTRHRPLSLSLARSLFLSYFLSFFLFSRHFVSPSWPTFAERLVLGFLSPVCAHSHTHTNKYTHTQTIHRRMHTLTGQTHPGGSMAIIAIGW